MCNVYHDFESCLFLFGKNINKIAQQKNVKDCMTTTIPIYIAKWVS